MIQQPFSLQRLSPGTKGVKDTLTKLASLRHQYSRDVRLRLVAEKIIRGITGDNSTEKQADRLLQWVKEKVQYVRDPNAWEYVKTPDLMLSEIEAHGRTFGDCDDHVLLLNTLLDTIGIRTKFIATVINGGATFNHVISGVYLSGRWVDIDPCAKMVPQPFFTTRLEVS